jgi:large conductance mechanosensitive channel
MSIKNIISEFKTFAIKGNAIELAVGIVIGTAFNGIVNSLVNDVIMQAVAMIFGQPNFASITIGAIRIGSFINAIVNFVIVAFSVFIAVKAVNRLVPRKPADNKIVNSK